MNSGHRAVLAFAFALVAAAAVGVAVHKPTAPGGGRNLRPSGTATVPSTSTVRTLPPSPGPSSAVLAGGLLVPTDLGGFYRVADDQAESLISSAGCLAGLGPSPAQSGRAVRGLLGPNLDSLPDITEVALSYPGAGAAAVFHALTSALGACSSFGITIGGIAVRVPMSESSLPAQVGDASALWRGQFSYGGRTEQLQVALVLDGKLVIAIIYIDSVPPSAAIMGDLPSTVSAAIGKLA